MSRTGVIATLVCLAIAAALGWFVYERSYRAAIDDLARTGALRVEQAAERLLGQVATYRVLVNVLAENPQIARTLAAEAGAYAAEPVLVNAALKYGAERISLVDADGGVVAASSPGGSEAEWSPVLAAALNGRLGLAHVSGGGRRRFLLGRGVFHGAPPAVGAVMMTVSIDALEFEWGIDPEAVGFFDGGAIFAANRQSLLTRGDWADRLADADAAAPAIVRFHAPDGLPAEALVIARPAPALGLVARGFFDVAPARAASLLRAQLAAALALLAALTAVVVTMWRRRMADRLAIETAANAWLETRVEERTTELRATQHQLVQASKMTALGEMSAGISHEVNQPLAAITNFAENGAKLLDRGRDADARANFGRIAEQAERISRIIRNLRGFARSEDVRVEPVDFAAAVAEAVSLMRAAIDKSGARLDWSPSDAPVMVMGGAVRLQQVVVNLIANALDAVAGADAPQLALTLESGSDVATLTVRDNGPGVADPSRVFEPFYSTKELGASKGLGLGLSVSYGIIGSFGGDIRCRNHPEGGAEFIVTLPRAEKGHPP